jgi:hypothetical protein
MLHRRKGARIAEVVLSTAVHAAGGRHASRARRRAAQASVIGCIEQRRRMKKTKNRGYELSSGNVFADLGFKDSEQELLFLVLIAGAVAIRRAAE